jgi:hypothetical protein
VSAVGPQNGLGRVDVQHDGGLLAFEWAHELIVSGRFACSWGGSAGV